jgi:hypothetical protein
VGIEVLLDWDREFDYFSNSGQRVTDDDAKALAAALARALPDIPDAGDPERGRGLLERFCGSEKPYLGAFVEFCRRGGFAIW